MSDTDSPDEGSGNDTVLSLETGAAAIESLLSGVPDDQDSVTNEESTTEDQASDVPATTEAADDETDGLELDDETTAQVDGAPEEPAFKQGQFAAKDAKVKLDDGSTISVADLIAGNMFQRTFTEKTTALSQEKKALEQERNQFAETKNQIEHQRTVILTLAQELIPQEPQPPEDPNDLVAYIEYTQRREEYNGKIGKLEALWNAQQLKEKELTEQTQKEREAAEAQQRQQLDSIRESERKQLFDKLPQLKEKTEQEKFIQEMHDAAKHYGLMPEDFATVFDHRVYLVMNDLIKFRRALAKRDAAKNPQAVATQAQQPRIQPKQRMAVVTPEKRDANVASDRLRKTGSLDDAAKALMKFV